MIHIFLKKLMNNDEQIENIRISRLEVFCKKDVLRNFAKCTGEQLCQSLFFTKVAGPQLY